jgi:hypothetical protein
MAGLFEEESTGVGFDGFGELPHPTAPVTTARSPTQANERLMDSKPFLQGYRGGRRPAGPPRRVRPR